MRLCVLFVICCVMLYDSLLRVVSVCLCVLRMISREMLCGLCFVCVVVCFCVCFCK